MIAESVTRAIAPLAADVARLRGGLDRCGPILYVASLAGVCDSIQARLGEVARTLGRAVGELPMMVRGREFYEALLNGDENDACGEAVACDRRHDLRSAHDAAPRGCASVRDEQDARDEAPDGCASVREAGGRRTRRGRRGGRGRRPQAAAGPDAGRSPGMPAHGGVPGRIPRGGVAEPARVAIRADRGPRAG